MHNKASVEELVFGFELTSHCFVIFELRIVMQEMMWLAINMIFSSVGTEKLQSFFFFKFIYRVKVF